MKSYSAPAFACFTVTTLLLLSSSYSFSFGTLMTTPQQRMELDKIRNGLISPVAQHSANPSDPTTKVLELDGLVKRHNGPNTIWVNGAVVKNTSIAGVSIDAGKLVESSVVFKLSAGTKPLLLKPGQRLGIEEGYVAESYKNDMQSNLGRNGQQFEEDDLQLPVYDME